MPQRRIVRPPQRVQVIAHAVPDAQATERMVTSLADQVDRQSRPTRSVIVVDLTVGDNRVIHLLGRKPDGCIVCPTVADATFAWALTDKSDTQATIEVVGVDQPGAAIEFW